MSASSLPGNWVATLHSFVRRQKPAVALEYCELCAAPIPANHSHLAEPDKGRLLCVCRGCATLLGNGDAGRFRLVPDRSSRLETFDITDAEWDATGIPIGLAFFFYSTPKGCVVAFYPGPAGPTECLLDLGAWSDLAARNPVLRALEPDVEAVLINRLNGSRRYYRVPIDRCYALVGLIRAQWRGVSGGSEAWRAIDRFFDGLIEEQASMGGRLHG